MCQTYTGADGLSSQSSAVGAGAADPNPPPKPFAAENGVMSVTVKVCDEPIYTRLTIERVDLVV